MSEGGEPFQWDTLVPLTVHPLKVSIIEALTWIDRPLSATQLSQVLDGEFSHMLVGYHLKRLTGFGVLAQVGQRRVRGATEHFYFFTHRNGATPAPLL